MSSLTEIANALKKKNEEQENPLITGTKPTLLNPEKFNELINGLMEATQNPFTTTPTAPIGYDINRPWGPNHPARINMTKLQSQLKAERNYQGLTQRELAKKTGMSQGSITRAEKNGWISITTLLRIANALGKEISLN